MKFVESKKGNQRRHYMVDWVVNQLIGGIKPPIIGALPKHVLLLCVSSAHPSKKGNQVCIIRVVTAGQVCVIRVVAGQV